MIVLLGDAVEEVEEEVRYPGTAIEPRRKSCVARAESGEDTRQLCS